ncbi:MAG: prepilin-type N-terminal cleavage/methylation domain-containing protein [Candidatus Hydrogenedentes bacterium]|nr:prepilin-type N-terminal cleavage/methylation domain-containing protein [Candidatus Hydrogenedentota bacterium]
MDRRGFSLVEALVVIAIIGILMAMYLPVLSKAKQKAKQTANMAHLHDEGIGQMTSDGNSRGDESRPTREAARAAFRENRGAGYGQGDDIIVSRMLFSVSNNASFRAYWHTLLNPANNDPIEYEGECLKARDESGKEFLLKPLSNVVQGRVTTIHAPMEWEFISTDLGDTSSGSMGTNVLYPDGHVQYIAYPGAFPATPTVSELSRRFMESLQ